MKWLWIYIIRNNKIWKEMKANTKAKWIFMIIFLFDYLIKVYSLFIFKLKNIV
jgi:hypothetical protein